MSTGILEKWLRAGMLVGMFLFFPRNSMATAAVASTVVQAQPQGLSGAPTELVVALAAAENHAARLDPANRIHRDDCAQLAQQHLQGCFSATAVSFQMKKVRHSPSVDPMRLRMVAWGREGATQPWYVIRSWHTANRIEYQGTGITEWWRVLPIGFEQGFTVSHAPKGTGRVVLQLLASRAPTVRGDTLNWGPLHYGALQVVDADGRVLPSTMRAYSRKIVLSFDPRHAHWPVTVDPLVWLSQEVVPDSALIAHQFGISVALSADGQTALVGMGDAPSSPYVVAGVYKNTNGTWTSVGDLKINITSNADIFASSVALSQNGQVALVGVEAANSNTGATYVFNEPASGWSGTQFPSATLTASGGKAGDQFGKSVALSANGATAIIGAYTANTGIGAAYIFTNTSGSWAQAATLAQPAGAYSFGISVALSADGSTALVGSDSANVGYGAAYVYARPTTGWATTVNPTATLTVSPGSSVDQFGNSVALSSTGNTALVGALGANYQIGAAYLYQEPSTGWANMSSPNASLTPTGGQKGEEFGSSVGLSSSGTVALIGAVQTMYTTGSASLFALNGGAWGQTEYLAHNYGQQGDSYAASIALAGDGNTVLVGSPGVSGNTGAAWYYTDSNLSAVLSAPNAVMPNAQFPSQYIVTNAGTSPSGDVVVTLPLPVVGAGEVSVSALQGSCTYSAGTRSASCDLGGISANGGMASATITLQATGATGTVITQNAGIANGNLGSPTNGNLSLEAIAGTAIAAPPSVSGLSGIIVTAPASGTETFAVGGTGTLSVTATSSNPTLVPDASITGASRCMQAGSCTLQLTPAANQSGQTTVTVAVTDAYGQQATGSFTMTVNAASPAPSAGGSGGGGALDNGMLLALAVIVAIDRYRASRLRRANGTMPSA